MLRDDRERLIEAIAADLGVRFHALNKWRQRGYVPYRWRMPIMVEATKRGQVLTYDDLGHLRPRREAS